MPSCLGLLFKKLFRTFRDGWKQFLALWAIGTLAITLFIGLISNAVSIKSRVEAVYEDGNLADIYVSLTSYDEEDETRMGEIAGESGEYLMEPRCEYSTLLAGYSSYCVVLPTVDENVHRLSKPISINYFSQVSDGEFFLIDEDLYKNNTDWFTSGAGVTFYTSSFADIIYEHFKAELSFESEEQMLLYLDNLVKSGGSNILRETRLSLDFAVSGTFIHPENITSSDYNASTFYIGKRLFRRKIREVLADNFLNYEQIYSYLGLGEEYDESSYLPSAFPNANQYLIGLSDDSKIEAVESEIRDYFQSKENDNLLAITDADSNPWSASANSDVTQSVQLCFVLPLVFFLVAVMVVTTTTSEIIVKERAQIGIMRSIPIPKAKIYRHYIAMTEVPVVASCLCGCALGPIIIPAIMGIKYDMLYLLPQRQFFLFPWLFALLSVAAFMLIAGFIAFIVARKEVSSSPVELMRPKAMKFKKRSRFRFERASSFSLSIMMALRNIRANWGKSLMVVCGVLGCTALCACSFGLDDTLKHGVEVELSTVYTADINLTYGAVGSYKEYIESIDGVAGAEEYSSYSSTASSLDEDGYLGESVNTTLRLYDEWVEHLKIEIPFDGIIISHKLSETLGVGVGDYLRFSYEGDNYELEIKGVEYLFVTSGIFASFSCLGVSEIEYTDCYVDAEEGADIVELSSRLFNLSFVQKAQSQSDIVETIDTVVSGVSMMTTAIKVFAVLLAVVVLYNLSLMNYRDRLREIATLKVLGFRSFEVGLSLVFETMFLTLIGTAFGLALGFPFMYLVLYVNKIALIDFLYCINPFSYVASFLISFVVGLAVCILLSFYSDRVDMVASLKSVE